MVVENNNLKNSITWHETISVEHLHRLFDAGQINVLQMAKCIVERLKRTSYFAYDSDPDLLDIVAEFAALNEYSTIDDYRIALDYLYDYADKDNRLWLESETPSSKEEIAEDTHIIKKPMPMYSDFVNEDTQPGVANPRTFKTLSAASTIKPVEKPDTKPDLKKKPILNIFIEPTGKKYFSGRTTRFMSAHEFDRKMKQWGLDPEALSKDAYEYVKDADDDYQNWLFEQIKEHMDIDISPEVMEDGV